jgi:hypothetical protein
MTPSTPPPSGPSPSGASPSGPSSSAGNDAARRAAAAAARRTGTFGGSATSAPPRTVLRPTAAQRALVPAAWGPTALVVALLLPYGPVVALVLAVLVAVGTWLLAGRSAVVLSPGELVVQRPLGKLVLPLADVREVERRRPVLTERAEVVRADGSRVPLPAPQSGPLPALRDPAFDERITLIRYRVAKGAPPGGAGVASPPGS